MILKFFIFGLFINSILTKTIKDNRSFVIDYENDRFLKDGETFRFISGALHYFRLPNEYWEDRLIKYKKAGLNTVQTYIEWSLHEPLKNKFEFDDDKNLFKFIEIAQKVGLYVILRPGPYICAERDNGGLPFWLKQLNPDVRIRSSDPKYFNHVEDWFKVLLPKLKPYLYENGGPVIMVQLENEYGSYFECDSKYLIQLRDLVKKELSNDVALFTTDGPDVNKLKCAMIPGVLPAIDFGTNWDVNTAFKTLRKVLPKGPLINNEFYPGWLDHWAEKHNKVSSQETCSKLDQILSQNASVNFYMFYGGTSFGFKAGANGNENSYQADTTSYDYDAPLNEYGNITQKYLDIQKTLSKYSKIEKISKDDLVNFIVPDPVDLKLLKENLIEILFKNQPFVFEDPVTFEHLGIDTGYVAYKTTINFKPSVPAKLLVNRLKDRAYVYIDNIFQGILDRETHINSSTVIAHNGSTLVILVENQGRINFDRSTGETKGLSKVSLGNHVLKNWQHYGTKDWNEIYNQVLKLEVSDIPKQFYKPRFFKGEFVLKQERKDTILDMANWSKGFVFINGKNLGRYWSTTGPQKTLYVPGVWLKNAPEKNTIILFEHELDPCFTDCKLSFTNKHEIDSDVPN